MIKIASYIDHTLLKPTATHVDIGKICKEAAEYGFAAVCVPPPFVAFAKEALLAEEQTGGLNAAGSKVKTATVIGFPFGYSTTAAKLAEAEEAIVDGADELDVVINLTSLKEGDWDSLKEEMELLTDIAHGSDRIIKVIIESGVLTDEEIIHCCRIYGEVGVDFLKTSTGYAEKGATLEAVRLMRKHLPPDIRIKASGGIRTYEFARQLVDSGADRLGCSASVAIAQGENAEGSGY